MGPELPAMKKARMSIQIGPVSSHFSGYHVSFQTSDLDDLTEEEIIKRLRQCGGAHQPTSYDFKSKVGSEASTTVEKVEQTTTTSIPPPKPETPSETTAPPPPPLPAKPETTTTAPPPLPAKPETTTAAPPPQEEATALEESTKKEDVPPTQSIESNNTSNNEIPATIKFTDKLKREDNGSNSSVNSTDSVVLPLTPSNYKDTVLTSGDIVEACVIESWNQVLDDNSPTNCMLCCDKNNEKRYTVLYTGCNGLNEFKSKLDDNYVIYGGFKVLGIDKRGSVVSTRSKFIFVTWVGSKVKLMTKAKVGMIKSEMHNIFRGTHIEFYCTQLDDLNEEEIVKKLRSSGGAHQPTEYTFDLNKEISG